MLLIKARTILTVLVLPHYCWCKILPLPISDITTFNSDTLYHNSVDSGTLYQNSVDNVTLYHNSLTALSSPEQCHLLAVCAILQARDLQPTTSSFMQGILALAEQQVEHPLSQDLAIAVSTGMQY